MSDIASRRFACIFLLLNVFLATSCGGDRKFQEPVGKLDTSFDTDGIAVTPGAVGSAVVIQVSSRIVVTGNYFGENFAVIRYNGDGSLDTSFGKGGIVTTDFSDHDQGIALVIQSDNKIVVVGESSANNSRPDIALARYNADGSLDSTFGINGKVTTDFGGSAEWGEAVLSQPDGKIVVAGFSNAGGTPDFAVVRYNGDGSLDATFCTNGKVTTDFGASGDVGDAALLQPDGKIVVAGESVPLDGSSFSDIALARYNSDSSLDSTFGTNGKVTTDIANGNDNTSAMVMEPDGRIVVVGYGEPGGLVIRYV